LFSSTLVIFQYYCLFLILISSNMKYTYCFAGYRHFLLTICIILLWPIFIIINIARKRSELFLVPSYFFKVLNQYYFSTSSTVSATYLLGTVLLSTSTSFCCFTISILYHLQRFFYGACTTCFTFPLLPPLSPPFSGTSLPTSCLSCGPVLCTHSSACCTPKIY
jgi:hypothetical protein